MHKTHPFLRCRQLLLLVLFLLAAAPTGQAYIANPPTTLGQMAGWSDRVMLARVEEVDRDKQVIVFRKVRDIKGKWPDELTRHVVKPSPVARAVAPMDAKEASYILKWAEKDKTAVLFSLDIRGGSPDKAMSHAYIDHCWYSTRTRGQAVWHAFSMEPNFLRSAFCGKPDQLATALDAIFAGKEPVVAAMSSGSKEDLRQGRAKIQGLRVGLKILSFNAKRDYLPLPDPDPETKKNEK